MKHDDFRNIADRGLSALVWDDAQRRRVLRQLQEKERPIMKKKAYTALILTAALLLCALTALAAADWPGILAFFTREEMSWRRYVVNESAIVQPLSQSSGSQWLDMEAREAYWTEDGLYIIIRTKAKEKSALAMHTTEREGEIPFEGTPLRWWELRQQEGLKLLLWQVTVSPEDSAESIAANGHVVHRWAHDGEYSTLMLGFPVTDPAQISGGCTLRLPITAEWFDGQRLSTLEQEQFTLTIQLPPMEMQPGSIEQP